jgi:hypothetical protein
VRAHDQYNPQAIDLFKTKCDCNLLRLSDDKCVPMINITYKPDTSYKKDLEQGVAQLRQDLFEEIQEVNSIQSNTIMCLKGRMVEWRNDNLRRFIVSTTC